MPVIVVANPKGGAGKSTASLVIGTGLAEQGGEVCIIDADPQGSLASWAEGESEYKGIVAALDDMARLAEAIEAMRESHGFVVVDLQGAATVAMAEAMAMADLVVIPTQATTLDTEVAIKAVGAIRAQEARLRRSVPFQFLVTRTNALIATREEAAIMKAIREAGLPVFATSLNQRVAFSQMFAQKLALDELVPGSVNGLAAAKANAGQLVKELLDVLRLQQGQAR